MKSIPIIILILLVAGCPQKNTNPRKKPDPKVQFLLRHFSI
jgi:hypothetical protein